MSKNKKNEISLKEKLEKALVPVEEQAYKIPDNWVWTRLGDIYNLFTGNSIPESEKSTKYISLLEGYKYIATKDVAYNGEINYENGLIIPYNEKKFKIAKVNSSLLCIEGGSAGRKVGIIDRDVCFGNKLCCFESNSNLENKIIYYYIKSENFLSLFRENMNGLIGGVNLNNLKKIEFPLAPLNEQKRIVEKLDFLFDKTKKAKEIIEEIKVDIENRKVSILDRAFKGILTSKWRNENKVSDVKELLKSINDEKIKKWEEDCIQAEKDGNKKPKKPIIKEIEDMIVPVEEQPYKIPDSWVWVRLGDIYNLFTGNSIPESEKTTKYINLSNGYKYIATKDISYDGEINYENGVIIPYNEEKFKVAKANSSLLCIEGGSAGRKVGIVDRDVCFVNKLCCFESNSNLESKIIYYYIKSENFLSLFRESMNGLIGGVSLNNLKKIEFPLPPLEEQQEIVRILDEVLENENKVKELLELEERIDILEKSILNKAFKGELGTQNSSDKSAIELLKSIL